MEPNEFIGAVETYIAQDQIQRAVDQMRADHPDSKMPSGDLQAAANQIGALHRAYIRRNKIWVCPHNPLGNVHGIFWAPFLPGYCCTNCYKHFCDAIHGTPEDRRCDLCQTIVDFDDFRGGVYTIPAIPQAGGRLLPPLTITFGVCVPCADKANQEEFQS